MSKTSDLSAEFQSNMSHCCLDIVGLSKFTVFLTCMASYSFCRVSSYGIDILGFISSHLDFYSHLATSKSLLKLKGKQVSRG